MGDLERAHGTAYVIRPATVQDVAYLPEIERSAQASFGSIASVARLVDGDVMTVDQHLTHLNSASISAGGTRLEPSTWVAALRELDSGQNVETSGVNYLAGFIVTSLLRLDEAGKGEVYVHIDELSVHPSHQRKGLARALLKSVDEGGRRMASEGINVRGYTLSTFQDVPFNGPFYQRLGFQVLPTEHIKEVVGKEGWKVWLEDADTMKNVGVEEKRCWMIKPFN